MVKDVVTMNL